MFDSFKDKALAAAKGQTFQAIKDGVKKATGVDINLNGQQNQQSTGYAPSGQNYYQQPNHGYAPPPPAAAPAPYPAQSTGKPSVPMRDASGASICYICHSSSFGRIMCGGCACVNCEKEPKMTNSKYCSTHGCSKCFQAKYANQDYCPSCLDKMKKAAAPPPPPPMAQQQQHYQQQSHHYQQQPQQYQQQPQQYQQQPHHYQQQPQQHYQQQPQQYQQQQTREMHQSYAPEPVQAPADPVELTALQLAELSLKQPGPLRDATGRSLCVRCRNPSFGKKACQECQCASCMEQAAIEGTDYCPNCTCPTFGCTQTKSRHDKVCSSCKTKMLYWGRDRWDLVEGPKDPAPSGLAVIVVDSFHADDLAKVKSQLPSNTVYLEPKCSPLQHVRFMVEGGWESYQRHDSHFLLVYDNELIFINENGDEQPCKLDTVGEAYELVKKYGESSLNDLEFEINKLAAPKMEGGINGVAFIYTSMFDEQPMKDIVANLKRPATAIDKVPTFGSVYNEDLREWLQFNNYQFPYFVRYDRSVEVVLMEPTAYRQIPCRNHQIEQLLDYIDQNPGRSDDYYNEYGNELIVAAAAIEDAEEAERKKVFTIGDGRGIPVFIIEKFWDSADVIEQALAGHDPKIIKLGGSYSTLGVLMSIEEFVPGHQGLIISVAHDDGVVQLSNPTQVVGRQQWLDVGMRFLPAVMEKMPASYVEYVLAQNDPRIARGRFVTYF